MYCYNTFTKIKHRQVSLIDSDKNLINYWRANIFNLQVIKNWWMLILIKKVLLYLIIFSLHKCIRNKIQHFYCFFKNLKILESAICWPSTVFGLLNRVRSVDHLPYSYWLIKIATRVCHVIPCRLCSVS